MNLGRLDVATQLVRHVQEYENNDQHVSQSDKVDVCHRRVAMQKLDERFHQQSHQKFTILQYIDKRVIHRCWGPSLPQLTSFRKKLWKTLTALVLGKVEFSLGSELSEGLHKKKVSEQSPGQMLKSWNVRGTKMFAR
jgi:hypothetical protein